jgi:hypothetical protein
VSGADITRDGVSGARGLEAAGGGAAGDAGSRRLRRKVIRVYVSLALAFSLLVALHVHGFSIGAWHDRIDGSPAKEELLGHAREERWDDWVVMIPLSLAQLAHHPPFPLVNRNVGLGQSALVPIRLPVADPLIAVRPLQWGWFLGPDVGLAWLWWGQVLGLFGVWLGVALVVTRGRLALSATGAALVLFAPFLQFSSLNSAPFVTFAGASWLAAAGVLGCRRRAAIWASGVGLGWASACFVLAPYPPFQVVLGHLVWVLLLGWALARRDDLPLRQHRGARVGAVALAVALVLLASGDFWLEARDAIAALAGSRYPGQRIAAGGGWSLWMLWNAAFAWPLQTAERGPLGPYLSSHAAFFLAWPLPAAVLAWRRILGRARIDPLLLALVLYCIVLTLWCVVGLPAPLARVTGLAFVPSQRALLGLGVADATLLVGFLAREPRPAVARGVAVVLAVGWTCGLGLAALALHGALPGTSAPVLAALVAVEGIWGFALLRSWRPALVAGSAAALLAVSTLWFNPIVVGGSAWLLENPLSRAIRAVDRSAGGGTTWISYGDQHVANLVRVLGLRSLNGVLPVPQPALWAPIDPGGAARFHYDRFAHVFFGLARPSGRFASAQDILAVYIDPEDGALERLGATHLLVRLVEPDLVRHFAAYEPLARVGDYALYALPLRPR